MKKIMILFGLMFSMTAFSQESYYDISYIDSCDAFYKYPGKVYTLVHKYVEKHGIESFHNILDSIEAGYPITSKTDSKIWEIFNYFFSFVYYSNLYVVSYSPDFKYPFTKRDIYLYRLDNDGWKQASKLIRQDYESQDLIHDYRFRRVELRPTYDEKNILERKDNRLTNGSITFAMHDYVGKPDNGVNYDSHPDIKMTFISNNDETFKAYIK